MWENKWREGHFGGAVKWLIASNLKSAFVASQFSSSQLKNNPQIDHFTHQLLPSHDCYGNSAFITTSGQHKKRSWRFQACSYVTGFLFTPDHHSFRKACNHDGTPSAETIPSNISVSCIPTAIILQHPSPNTHRHKSTRLVHSLRHSLQLYLISSSLICLLLHLRFPRPPSL